MRAPSPTESLTHLHYDHVGNFSLFPQARFHLQEREVAYATGRYMRYPYFAHGFELEDVLGIVRLNYAARIERHSGTAELAPGIFLHHAPGHTAGLQVVRVHTRRGWVVLASDATHYYENLSSNRPFTVALHLGQVVDSFRLLEALAASPDHIAPGHEPGDAALSGAGTIARGDRRTTARRTKHECDALRRLSS